MSGRGAPADDLAHCQATPGCITCGDTALPMGVLSVDAASGLAVCAGLDGAVDEVEVELVGPVAEGDALLVHAGVALARLDSMEEVAP